MSIARMMEQLSEIAIEVACPRCGADVGKCCMSVHPRKSSTPAYPVKPHRERKLAAVDARKSRR